MTFVAAVTVVVLVSSGPFYDSGTSQWFNSLLIPGTRNSCCDQADCWRTLARAAAEGWWAESRKYPGEWVLIPANRVLAQFSIFGIDAVLCEGDEDIVAQPNGGDVLLRSSPSGKPVWVYCFVPPVQAF